jgi:hypothetical protein
MQAEYASHANPEEVIASQQGDTGETLFIIKSGSDGVCGHDGTRSCAEHSDKRYDSQYQITSP